MLKFPRIASAAVACLLASPALFAFTPNDPLYSPTGGFPGQWHLNAGGGANVVGAWNNGWTGQGVVIGIVDDAIQWSHPDLRPNYISSLSYDYYDRDGDPTPEFIFFEEHGTAVAGIAVARGGNGIGVTGAAPYAQWAGYRTLFYFDPALLESYLHSTGFNPTFTRSGEFAVDYTLGNQISETPIDVMNHSYGAFAPYSDILNEELSRALADTADVGVIHVVAGGNERDTENQDSNKSDIQTSPNVINVAALRSDNTYASYSNFGANIFVSAPGGASAASGDDLITTTDRTGSSGYNTSFTGATDLSDKDYTAKFNGTSAAAPLVSGIMALGKEANPGLDVRMAQHTLARTAVKIDASDTGPTGSDGWMSWTTTGNTSDALNFNPNYGFGKINAETFVDKVQTGGYVTQQSTGTLDLSPGSPVTLAADTSWTNSGAFGTSAPLEAVKVTVKITPDDSSNDEVDNAHRQDLRGTISYNGRNSIFMYDRLSVPYPEEEIDDDEDSDTFEEPTGNWVYTFGDDQSPDAVLEWTFTTWAFWGLDPSTDGNWTITISDEHSQNDKTFEIETAEIEFIQGDVRYWTPGATNNVTTDETVPFFSVVEPTAGTIVDINSGTTISVLQNSYVTNGTLDVNGTLGTSGTFGSALTLSGGTLILDDAGTINTGRYFLQNGGTLTAGLGTFTTGSDYVQSAGSATLAGTNLSVGGNMFLQGGSLGISGTVAPTTDFYQSAGAMTITTGAFNLTGDYNLIDGTTTLTDGTLGTSGDVTLNGGTFAYDNTSTLTIGNDLNIGGTANFTYNSNATTTITNDLNQSGSTIDVATGDTLTIGNDYNLAGGTLNLQTGATVDPSAFNLTGGILQGTGTVDAPTTATGGIIYPGGDGTAGTLNFGSTLTSSGNANMKLDVNYTDSTTFDAAGSDTIAVTGDFNAGGTFTAALLPGSAIPKNGEETDPVLTTTGNVSGTFDKVSSVIAPVLFLDPVYRANDITLKVTEDYANEILVNYMSDTGKSVGRMLNALLVKTPTTDQRKVMDEIVATTTFPEAAAAIQQLSPEATVKTTQSHTLKTVSIQADLFKQRARLLRMATPTMSYANYEWRTRQLFMSGSEKVDMLADTSAFTSLAYRSDPFDPTDLSFARLSVWGSASATFGDKSTDGSDIGYEYDSISGMVGIDYLVSDRWSAGVFAGMGTVDTNSKDAGSSAVDSDFLMLGAYSTFTFGKAYWDVMAGYGTSSFDQRRRILIGGINRTATSSTDGSFIVAMLNGGYEYEMGDWHFGPRYGIQYVHNNIDGYTETGAGGINLRVGESGTDSLRHNLGFEVSKNIWTLSTLYIPSVRLGWIHDYMDDAQTINASFATNGVDFDVYTPTPDRDFGTLGTGMMILFDNDINLSFDYDYTFSSTLIEHNLNSKISYSF